MTDTLTAPSSLDDRAVDFAAMRRAMVESQLRPTDVNDPVVIAAMALVPREDFVAPDQRAFAYIDRALPVAPGRVLNPALATGLLLNRAGLRSDDRVLLIGAGTGYAAAVLAGIVREVVALEDDAALAARAADLLAGARNVSVVEGPLAKGHGAKAPYSLIVIDGAVEQLPDPLVDQLAEDGRLVCGLVESGVTRLAIGRKSGGAFALLPFTDSDIAPLAAFAKPKGYQF